MAAMQSPFLLNKGKQVHNYAKWSVYVLEVSGIDPHKLFSEQFLSEELIAGGQTNWFNSKIRYYGQACHYQISS